MNAGISLKFVCQKIRHQIFSTSTYLWFLQDIRNASGTSVTSGRRRWGNLIVSTHKLEETVPFEKFLLFPGYFSQENRYLDFHRYEVKFSLLNCEVSGSIISWNSEHSVPCLEFMGWVFGDCSFCSHHNKQEYHCLLHLICRTQIRIWYKWGNKETCTCICCCIRSVNRW